MLHKSLIFRPVAKAASAAASRTVAGAAAPRATPTHSNGHAHAAAAAAATAVSNTAAAAAAKAAVAAAPLPSSLPNVAFLGFGVMAKAMAAGMQTGNPVFRQYYLCDQSKKALESASATITAAPVFTTRSAIEAAKASDVLVLAVKPQGMAKLLKSLPIRRDQILVSIVAGWSIDKIRKHLPKVVDSDGEPVVPKIIRTMPNTPLQVGRGCTLYSPCDLCNESDWDLAESMFNGSGIVEMLDESQLDAATGIAGSGPSYVALFMEALADGAVKQGLPRDLAIKLAAHTVEGAARMCTADGGGLHPAILKDRVCSPGGTSIHGVAELESHGVRKAIIAAVAGATQRSKDLNKL